MMQRYIISPLIASFLGVLGLAVLTEWSIAEVFNLTVFIDAVRNTFSDSGSLIMIGVLFGLINFCSLMVGFMKAGE